MGEARLGLIKGVISTLPGFLSKSEVVEVEFDPKVIPYKELVMKAQEAECAKTVYPLDEKQRQIAEKRVGRRALWVKDTVKPDKDPKYYLSKTDLRFIPMTPLQATRINAMVDGPAYKDWLSPSQVTLLKRIEAHPKAGWRNVIGQDILQAWQSIEGILARLE